MCVCVWLLGENLVSANPYIFKSILSNSEMLSRNVLFSALKHQMQPDVIKYR